MVCPTHCKYTLLYVCQSIASAFLKWIESRKLWSESSRDRSNSNACIDWNLVTTYFLVCGKTDSTGTVRLFFFFVFFCLFCLSLASLSVDSRRIANYVYNFYASIATTAGGLGDRTCRWRKSFFCLFVLLAWYICLKNQVSNVYMYLLIFFSLCSFNFLLKQILT